MKFSARDVDEIMQSGDCGNESVVTGCTAIAKVSYNMGWSEKSSQYIARAHTHTHTHANSAEIGTEFHLFLDDLYVLYILHGNRSTEDARTWETNASRTKVIKRVCRKATQNEIDTMYRWNMTWREPGSASEQARAKDGSRRNERRLRGNRPNGDDKILSIH